MDKNSIDCFDILYIKNLAPMKIALQDSARFGELRYATDFTDEEKVEYMHELYERRFKAGEYEYFNANKGPTCQDAARAARAKAIDVSVK